MIRNPSSFHPVFESLEGRTLFAAAPAGVVAELGGPLHPILTVTGTRRSDDIAIVLVGDQIEVRSRAVAVNSFPRGDVLGITVLGLNGKDSVVVDAAVTIPAYLQGGNGRDLLIGGSGNDNIDGGNARDTIVGGAGDDVLSGGRARDVLDGGDGNDTLTGGLSRDASTGGTGADTFSADIASEILDMAVDDTLVP